MLVWLLAAPVAFTLIVVLGAIIELPLAAVLVFVVYYVVIVATAAAALIVRIRKQSPPPAEPVIPRPGPAELATRGIAADEPAEWARVPSPFVDRLRAVRHATLYSRRTLMHSGMQTRSAWLREPLAYLVTNGRFDYRAFETLILAADEADGSAEVLLKDIDLDLTLAMSRLVASQLLSERDQAFARAANSFVLRQLRTRKVARGNQLFLAERVILAGQLELAREMTDRLSGNNFTELLLRADVVNPFHPARVQESEEVWLAGFNGIYAPYGLEPVTLADEGVSNYDRLRSTATSTVDDGPLISVIMSCFRPDHALTTAVESMIAQSWQNWELLIIDDASPEEYGAVLDAAARMDPRVRVLRATENGGTYVRRNDAIREARGEFVTMHDSDDWVHPRRLELQARHLLAHPSLPANLSYSLRVSEDLMFVQARGATLRLTESSLLFRKDLVVGRIGYFDSVRKAADSEYRLRIEAAFRTTVPVIDTLSPLALVRYTATSLSGSDLGDGWMHPARLAYRSATQHFHSAIRNGTADPFMPFPLVERPFPVHEHLLGRPRPAVEYDVLYVVDGRTEAHAEGQFERILAELESLVDTHERVGLLHLPLLTEFRTQAIISVELQRLINAGRLSLVLVADIASASTVVVRDAALLQTAPTSPTQMAGDRVVLVDDRAPAVDERGRAWSRPDVEDAARRLFGAEPEWVVADEEFRADMVVTVERTASVTR